MSVSIKDGDLKKLQPAAILLILFLPSCATPRGGHPSIDDSKIGAEDEPERQQRIRQLRPPVAYELGLDGTFTEVPHTPDPSVPVREEDFPPYPVKTLLVIARTSSSITLRWHDRSQAEEGTRLRRREASGSWQEVASFGPASGFNDVTDEPLAPDRLYCYQFVTFNEHGESFSPQRCAYTRGLEPRVVFRAQLTLQTGDVPNAGTDDQVTARLNSKGFLVVPGNNVTVMDYGRDDFERADRFTYDLGLDHMTNLEDVTQISLSKTGSDGWCLERLALEINGRRVFERDLATAEAPCQWLDNDSGNTRSYIVTHADLRGHPDWQSFVAAVPLAFSRDEIESRIEGMVGHLIAAKEDAEWGDRNGRAWVETAPRPGTQRIRVDLDLEGIVPILKNPDVDLDFDVTPFFTRRDDERWEFELSVSNLETDVDFDWFIETVSFLLPCGVPIGEPDCISALERYIEKEIYRGFQPVASSFLLDDPCQRDLQPMACLVATPQGELVSVTFSCVESERPCPDR